MNTDLEVTVRPAGLDEEHFALYERYVNTRHFGGGMDDPTPDQYEEFLTCRWAETDFFEFRLDSALIAVGVSDRLPDGLSAVYTYFDPGYASRGLGVYAVLWQIDYARRTGLDWVYLGYWIEAAEKMSYKSQYQPQEHLIDGRWVEMAAP